MIKPTENWRHIFSVNFYGMAKDLFDTWESEIKASIHDVTDTEIIDGIRYLARTIPDNRTAKVRLLIKAIKKARTDAVKAETLSSCEDCRQGVVTYDCWRNKKSNQIVYSVPNGEEWVWLHEQQIPCLCESGKLLMTRWYKEHERGEILKLQLRVLSEKENSHGK